MVVSEADAFHLSTGLTATGCDSVPEKGFA
jgi:hypothetical protein